MNQIAGSFPQTIHVFNKIAQKQVEAKDDIFGTTTSFKVSEKQFAWLVETYSRELLVITNARWNGIGGASVTDEDGTIYSFSWESGKNNVPRYIKDHAIYGKSYFIKKSTPKNQIIKEHRLVSVPSTIRKI